MQSTLLQGYTIIQYIVMQNYNVIFILNIYSNYIYAEYPCERVSDCE